MKKENLIKNMTIESRDSLLLIERIFQSNHIDITRYKMQFLKRRVERRMQIKEICNFNEYLNLLKTDSNEFISLFESLSINVTSFFRDANVYNTIRNIIVQKISSNLETDKMIDVWSAGCASGEEPYSIAILLNDILGISKKIGVHIMATDINNKAIDFAQNGKYSSNLLAHLPEDLKKKYFTKLEDHANSEYEIMSKIKDLIDFETMDILSSPDHKYDIIFCRNVLIYYEKDAQDIILKKFHSCLKNGGYLVLGSDEILISMRTRNIFYPVMPIEKIFQKINL